MKSLRAIRRRLARDVCRAAPALLFGSAALEILHPELLDHEPRDVDFFVPTSSLEAIVAAIPREWRSWDEPFEGAHLAGRYYVRGTHPSEPTIDLTYEGPMEWEQAWARRREVDGIIVANVVDLQRVYRARGRTGDDALASRLER